MAATMSDIRNGIANSLSSLGGSDASASWNVGAYATSQSVGPFVQVVGAQVEFDAAMSRGADVMEWIVVAGVPATMDQSAQQRLEAIIDPLSATSVKTLVEADKTLGGKVAWARVVRVTRPALYSTAGQPEWLGVEFTIEVMT